MTKKAPLCPVCGKRLRVKPAPRTKWQQLWQCKDGLATHPEDCEWTNPMLQMLLSAKQVEQE